MPREPKTGRQLPRASRIFTLSRDLRDFTARADWAWQTRAQQARTLHLHALGVLTLGDESPGDDIPDDGTLSVKEN